MMPILLFQERLSIEGVLCSLGGRGGEERVITM